MAFKPGQSGNPSGSKPGSANHKSMVKRMMIGALRVLDDIQNDSSASMETRLEAAREILNYTNKEVIL